MTNETMVIASLWSVIAPVVAFVLGIIFAPKQKKY